LDISHAELTDQKRLEFAGWPDDHVTVTVKARDTVGNTTTSTTSRRLA
jgi:hypothetical protein